MEKEEIRRRIKEGGQPLGRMQREIIEYLIEEERIKGIEEIVERIYKVEGESESAKNSMRKNISTINKKIRGSGVEIRSRYKIGYYIGEREKRRKKRSKSTNRSKEIKQISSEELKRIINELRKERKEWI